MTEPTFSKTRCRSCERALFECPTNDPAVLALVCFNSNCTDLSVHLQRSLFASSPTPATAGTPDETRWLIGWAVGGPKWVARLEETSQRFGGGMYARTTVHHWTPVETTSVDEAMQFCRERDAVAFLESIAYPWRGILRIEEHLWTDAGRTDQPSAALDAIPTERATPNASESEMVLRRGWWLSHGCIGLYGDDGEMQCGRCLIDFKRDDPSDIERRLLARGVKLMAEQSAPAPAREATPTPAAFRVVDVANYVWRFEEFEQDANAEAAKMNAASQAKSFRVEPLYAAPIAPRTVGGAPLRDETPEAKPAIPSPTREDHET